MIVNWRSSWLVCLCCRHHLKLCSVLVVVHLLMLILEFAATVEKMSTSVISAGLFVASFVLFVSRTDIRCVRSVVVCSTEHTFNVCLQVYKLWWERSIPMQCLWILQIRQVWLHSDSQTLLCCWPNREWRRSKEGTNICKNKKWQLLTWTARSNTSVLHCVFLVDVCVIISFSGGCQHKLSFGASGQSVSAASVSQTALGPAVKPTARTWTARATPGEQFISY